MSTPTQMPRIVDKRVLPAAGHRPWAATERRVRRSPNSAAAIEIALAEAARQTGCDAILITDDKGMLVSKSPTALVLDMLAAVTPIVARGEARAHIKRQGQARELSVESVDLLGERLHVAALGSDDVQRRRALASCVAAARRILAS